MSYDHFPIFDFPLTYWSSMSGMGGVRYRRSIVIAMPAEDPEPAPAKRPKQVHCRGRWRVVKRKVKALARELDSLKNRDAIAGRLAQAVAKQRAFFKLEKVRRHPGIHRAARARATAS